MNSQYLLNEPSRIFSPALLFYRDVITRNIARTIELAGSPHRLRPHVKTHKTREIARLWIAAGVTKHKCATIAEAELLATSGAPDVLIAFPMVGPNCERVARLAVKYPETRFGVTIDHPKPLRELQLALARSGRTVDAYLDINCGMNRTGIAAGSAAEELYRQISAASCLVPAGLHVYDGHNNKESIDERTAVGSDALIPVLDMRQRLIKSGLPVDRIVIGGTPSFPVHAKLEVPGVECSPGTLSLHDFNYSTRYGELGITPAALLLTRVVDKPTPDRITLDLGSKAVSADQPVEKRCSFLNIRDAAIVMQSEEHLVVKTPDSASFEPGDVVYAMPAHVCPSVALHRQALVVVNGEVVERWDIVGRDRELTV
jgi:D-serine deaminase-like pyridoxal phosphate-dependent protein